MEAFFVLLGLAALAALVLGPAGFFIALRAREKSARTEELLAQAQTRIAEAEARLATLEARPGRTEPVRDEAESGIAAEPAQASDKAQETGAMPEAARAPDPEQALAETFIAPAEPASTPPRRSLEETLGARWSVIVGGIALALGALLLVRYSIEQGFFGPAMRVALGLALAAALIGAGEFMRRRERAEGDTPPPDNAPAGNARPDIPAILTAAGTVAAFGSIYAAHALYGFIGPATAFIALAAAGVACMFASALHGPALAALGLVGALGSPVLVSSTDPTPWPVAALAAAVCASAYWLARMRRWLWLAASAAFGGGLWGLAFLEGIATRPEVFFAGSLTHLLAQTALAAGVFAFSLRFAPEEDAAPEAHSGYAAAGFAALAAATLLAGLDGGAYGSLWLIGALLAFAIPAATGFVIAPAAAALAIAGAFAVIMLRAWPDPSYAEAGQHWSPSFAYDHWPRAMDEHFFAVFGLLTSGVVAAAGGWRIAIARALPFNTLAIYAGAAALTPLAALSMAFVRLTDRGPSMTFALTGAALALGFALAAAVFRNREAAGDEPADIPNARFGAGVFASAAIASLALSFVFALSGATLTVALALAALGAAYVSAQLRISALRWCVAALGVLVAVRLALDPRLLADAGPWPILNWLLFAYGIPALSFGAAAWIMRRAAGEDMPVRIAQSLCILFSAFLAFFEIRHFINGGDAFARRTGLVEQGLFAVSALSFAIVLTRLDARRSSIVFRWASLIAGALSFGAIALGLGFAGNPLFSYRGLEGGRFVNALLIGYALPAALALVLARVSESVRPYWYCLCAKACAIALAFGYVTLQTRRLFHNERLGFLRGASDAEWYAYSAVWLAMGIALLAWGLVRGSKEARIASAIFVSASVLKVFLFDLAGLEGALRALSFIGLGATLIAIGLVYQKLVFARPAPPRAGEPTPTS
jgi:uncharacterized membrane protein